MDRDQQIVFQEIQHGYERRWKSEETISNRVQSRSDYDSFSIDDLFRPTHGNMAMFGNHS